MEKTYRVTITEILQKDVYVSASELDEDTPEAAAMLVKSRWKNADYVLDADNFVDVDFEASVEDENRTEK